MSENNNNQASSGQSSKPSRFHKPTPSQFAMYKPEKVLSPMAKAKRLAKKIPPSAMKESPIKPTISPLTFPIYNKNNMEDIAKYESSAQNIIWGLKSFHQLSTSTSTNIPSSKMISLEKSINDLILNAVEDGIDIDALMEYIYSSKKINLEQKCVLREMVVNLFSNSISIINHEDDELEETISQANIFAIPMFGKVSSFLKIASNQEQISKLCNLVVGSGYLSPNSKVVALMNKPLNPRALYQPSVLRALSIYWANLISEESNDEKFNASLKEIIEESINPYLLDENEVCSFIIPGIRIWNGTRKERNKLSEMFNDYNKSSIKKSVFKSWWQTTSGHISLSSNVEPGDLLIKPPSLPLPAHAKSIAWHMTQQVYEGLGQTPFTEISLVSTNSSSDSLSLRAYDKNKKIIAQSDPVPLFEATTSSDDFSALIYEECGVDGPRTFLRETLRTLDPNPNS